MKRTINEFSKSINSKHRDSDENTDVKQLLTSLENLSPPVKNEMSTFKRPPNRPISLQRRHTFSTNQPYSRMRHTPIPRVEPIKELKETAKSDSESDSSADDEFDWMLNKGTSAFIEGKRCTLQTKKTQKPELSPSTVKDPLSIKTDLQKQERVEHSRTASSSSAYSGISEHSTRSASSGYSSLAENSPMRISPFPTLHHNFSSLDAMPQERELHQSYKPSSGYDYGSLQHRRNPFNQFPGSRHSIAVPSERSFRYPKPTRKAVLEIELPDTTFIVIEVDESATVRHVFYLLLESTGMALDINWVILQWYSSGIERCLEDHENMFVLISKFSSEVSEDAPRYKFIQSLKKFDVFLNPHRYLLEESNPNDRKLYTTRSKSAIVNNFFQNESAVPSLEGVLYVKKCKKSWKKRYIVLRASGLYMCKSRAKDYIPSLSIRKKQKKLNRYNSKDLKMLVNFDYYTPFYCKDFKKAFKSPSEFCFCLKSTTKSKDLPDIYFSASEQMVSHQWVTGIRIAKFGRQLYVNFQHLHNEIEGYKRLRNNKFQRSPSLTNFIKEISRRPQSFDSYPGARELSHSFSVYSLRSTSTINEEYENDFNLSPEYSGYDYNSMSLRSNYF